MDEKIPIAEFRSQKFWTKQHNILISITVPSIAGFIAWKIINFIDINWITLVVFSPIYLALPAKYFTDKGMSDILEIICILYLAVISYFVLKKFKFPPLRGIAMDYRPCPYEDCDKSIKLVSDWICDYCHNLNVHQSILDQCQHCGRIAEVVICEHCKREIKL